MNNKNLVEFEKIIEYKFKDNSLLRLALTHSSFANEHKLGKNEYNERLEFLGDAALDLIVSRHIYKKFPELPEGELSKLRASVVCEGSLAKKAREISLGNFLLLGKGEEITGGRNRDSVLADAFEAVIGAIYLDGGMECAEKYVESLMADVVENLKSDYRYMDCKTRLQEIIQKISKDPISYAIVNEEGPDHNKVFEAQVCHEGRVLGVGKGRSKKEAEQSAASDAISKMNK
ncbi:MAG: ribonuclease III [Firmicutes bacterium]|nr:ribonuclease III [Bacillota bacterium]